MEEKKKQKQLLMLYGGPFFEGGELSGRHKAKPEEEGPSFTQISGKA